MVVLHEISTPHAPNYIAKGNSCVRQFLAGLCIEDIHSEPIKQHFISI